VLLFIIVLPLAAVAVWRVQRDDVTEVPADVYVALGASDAVGVGADDPANQGWVPQFHATLPTGTNLLNLGISGATVHDVLVQQLPPALDAKPRWVTIWPGVNDLRRGIDREVFQRQLDQVLAQLNRSAAAGDTQQRTIIVLNIPDIRHLPVFADIDHQMLDQQVQAWNAGIADTARRHGAIVVDLYARWPELAVHPEYISSDGFHPSSAGYRRIAELVRDALQHHVSSNAP
jgi:lysophospholipase L1-like esterase